MKKIYAALILLLGYFSFFTLDVLAADLDVTCDSGSCSVLPSGPLFSETNIYPNWGVTKTIKAINNYTQDATFAVEVADLTDLNGLGDILEITIKKTGDAVNIYNDNLTNFKNYGYLLLSDISAGGTQDYDFGVKMQKSADDQYQNLNLDFDLTLGFELLPLSSSPTSTPTPSGCIASAPFPPTSLVAAAVSSSVINLTWIAPLEAVTHYAVSYGISSGSYTYGAANIGSVTSYTISELSSGTTYYFVVYAVNDCASSGPSSETSAVTFGVLGAFVAPGPAPGFEVLGEVEESDGEGEVGGGISTGVAGAVTAKRRYWPLVFIFLAIVLWVVIRRKTS